MVQQHTQLALTSLLVAALVSGMMPVQAASTENVLDLVQEDENRYRGMWNVDWIHDADLDGIDDRFPLEYAKEDHAAIIVGFDHAPGKAEEALLTALGVEIDFTSKYIDAIFAVAPVDIVESIAAIPSVVRVEMTETMTAFNNIATEATKVQPSSTYSQTVWDDLGYRGSGITIAILDTAVDDHQHSCLSGKYLGGYDAINSATTNPNDGQGHGTHVACTALGHGGTSSYPYGTHAGSAPEARLVDIQVLTSSGSSSGNSVAEGIEWAIDNRNTNWGVSGYNGIDIISLSLGGSYDSDGTDGNSLLINSAADNGLIAVIAAGNSGDQTISSPGSADKAITVANMNDDNTATRSDDTIWWSSSRGPRNSDGDGDSADEQKPEVAAPGANIRSAQHNTASSYVDFTGTSMATPHMAGIIALMLEANPGLQWDDVEQLIIDTSDDHGSAGWDGTYGHGYVDGYDIVAAAAAGSGPLPPTASFTYTTGAFSVDVDGSGSSDPNGDPLTYSWTFGDGATATGVTASHTYASTGTYTVTLTVNDGNGGSDTDSQAVDVTDGSDPDPSTPNLSNGVAQTVTLSGSGDDDHWKIEVPAGATSLTVAMDPVSGSHDFDLYTRQGARATDSTYDCRPYTGSSDEDCSHSNPAADWWYVRVDSYSGSGSVSITATHDGGGPSNNAPTASFTHSENDLTVSVDGTGSSDPDGDSLSYSWTFGDGSSGSGATASHAYASAGTYTVTLTVDDGNGGSDSSSQSVTVTAPPSGDPYLTSGVASSGSLSGSGDEDFWRISVPSGATALDVVLDGPSGSDFDLYTRAGDRPTDSTYACRPYTGSSDETCNHTNPAAGDWYVRVDSYSGSGSYTVTATVTTPTPNNDPTASFTESCANLACDFDGSGSSDPDGDTLSYSWTFGDGNSGSGATPSHTYASAGTYTATLTVDDGNGGTDSTSHSVAVTAPANQAPTASFTESCTDLACDFDASGSSDSDGSVASYSWDFGDGSSGSGATPSHTYASAGTYTVSLTVTDDDGATDSTSHSVTVTAPPPPPQGCADNGDGITEMTSGSQYSATVSEGQWAYGKICVTDGDMTAAMTGPACTWWSCSLDADLYVKAGSVPTTSDYDCRPYLSGSAETCNVSGVPNGWVYIGIYGYSGSGTVQITATD